MNPQHLRRLPVTRSSHGGVCVATPLSYMQNVLFANKSFSLKKAHSCKHRLRGLRSKESYELLKYIQGILRQIIYPLCMLVFKPIF